MKKTTLTLALLFFILTNNFGQRIAFYDALYLKSIIAANPDGFKISAENRPVLNYYFGTGLTDAQLTAAIQANPFLEEYFQTAGTQSIPAGLTLPGIASSIGGLDVTNFADGLAKFLVERVKQELSTSFFERFKSDLDSIRQLQIIFPATYNALKAIDKQIYNYTAYLDLLRDSFQKDLTFLLPNIGRLTDDKCMDVVFIKFPEVRVMLSDALYIVNDLNEGMFPGDALHNYLINKADKKSLGQVNKYLYPSLATLDLFSQSLRSRQAGHYWVSSDSLKLLFDDHTTFRLYMGLIYQQAIKAAITITDQLTLVQKLKLYAAKTDSLILLYQPYLTGLIEKGKSIDYYFTAMKEKQKAGLDKPTYQDYYSLYDASFSLLEYLSNCPFIDDYLANDKVKNLEDYFHSARSLGNIYVDVYEKQYTSAVVEFTGLFQTLLNEKIKMEIAANELLIKADAKQKQTLNQANESLKSILNSSALILKYGSLAAAIAKAETSDDVKNAIEAAALPAGSSRIKRETPFNVSLNAYTGLFIGYEKIVQVDDHPALNSYGLAAPVGVAISCGTHRFLGMPCKGAGHWSYSAFVSFIDIGAIASFRFQNDSVAQVPSIKLQDIFSPGVFFSVGIPKCPLSVNMGAQVGPNLRKVNVYDAESGEYVNKYENNVYWRFSISLVVDIPIVNFYTKSR